MGLPSGLLWSAVDLDYTLPGNVAASPFTYAKSFVSWGNIDPHNPTRKNSFTPWDWGGINAQEPWYDGQVYGDTPGASLESNIPLSMDVCNVLLGSSWRMPSASEFGELITNCDFVMADGSTVIPDETADKRVTVNGVIGIYLKSKINGQLIFFACSGNGFGTSWYYRGSYGLYWSASYNSDRYAYNLYFNNGSVNPRGNGNRYFGLPVRPIFDPSL